MNVGAAIEKAKASKDGTRQGARISSTRSGQQIERAKLNKVVNMEARTHARDGSWLVIKELVGVRSVRKVKDMACSGDYKLSRNTIIKKHFLSWFGSSGWAISLWRACTLRRCFETCSKSSKRKYGYWPFRQWSLANNGGRKLDNTRIVRPGETISQQNSSVIRRRAIDIVE